METWEEVAVREGVAARAELAVRTETEASIIVREVATRKETVAFAKEVVAHKGMEATTGEVAFTITAFAIADTSIIATSIATITITMIAITAKTDTDQLVCHLI